MDLTNYYGVIIVLAMAVYMTVGWYFKGLKNGEKFDFYKCAETVVLVVLLTITGLMSGITVTAEWLNSLLGTLGNNPATLTAILAALIGLIDQFIKNGGKLLQGNTAAAQAATTEQAKATLATPASGSPAFPAGLATVLGLCRDSTDNAPAAASLTFDVNQIPNLLYQLQCVTTGKVMTAIEVDDVNLTDSGEEGINFTQVGQKISRPFFIPQKLRKVGKHVVTIYQGHLEGAEDISPGGEDSEVVWDSSASFIIEMTGTKASD